MNKLNMDAYETFWMIFMHGTVDGSTVIKPHSVRFASHQAAKKTAAKLVEDIHCSKATIVQCLPMESVRNKTELVWETGDDG